MHESRGLSQGEPIMEVDVVQRNKGLDLETEKLLIKKSGPKGLHIVSIVSGSGGSAGDESSSDEPAAAQRESSGSIKTTLKTHHAHHHALHPKKYRLKEPSLAPLLLERPLSRGRSPIPTGSGSSKDEDEEMLNIDDSNEDDDKSSGPSVKDSGVSHSFTSGENSESEMGCDGDGDGDGDDILGLGKQEDLNRKVFECDVCNMKFSNGANMRRHRMRHTGVKPYECRVCQKRFFRKDHLAEHMATHSKLLPFRCPICNKGFQRQIAMRAHFQNEHVGGSHDMVKACPLCSYKAGSMKSLRVHFYSRHGIDLDNPMPHSPSLQGTSNGGSGSPGPCGSGNGEYSELAQALGFDDREKSSDSSLIPSHFLVPQIEISANSPYPSNFFTPDSSFPFTQDERQSDNGDSPPPPNVSPVSDTSSNTPSSSDLVVVKREVMDDHEATPEQSSSSARNPKPNQCTEIGEEVQDGPEDLSQSGNKNTFRSTPSSKSSSPVEDTTTLSPLKSLLRDDWRRDTQNGGTNHNHKSSTNGSSSGSISTVNSHSNGRTGTSAHSAASNGFQTSAYDGETITSSNGSESSASPQSSSFNRRGGSSVTTSTIHQCVYCGIIFPDKTLYFLHKGCHSSPPQMWRCNICGESCTNVYDFNSHLLSKSHQ